MQKIVRWLKQTQNAIATLAVVAILLHLVLRYVLATEAIAYNIPLWAALALGGTPLVVGLLTKAYKRQFGSDILAGISIVTSVILGEYLAGTLVVLMLSGGEAIEAYAVRSASSVLEALAARIPSTAHRKVGDALEDISIDKIEIGDTIVIFPHETCPVDGTVTEGRGSMDESYLTGEPYNVSKTPGSKVLSGAINSEAAITIRADKVAHDSRYAKIMQVMKSSQQFRPKIRRLGDQLGAIYTPIAVAIAAFAWYFSGEATRFLAVLVVATPCPLLIAIPVAIIGSISLAAKRSIIVRDPAVLEQAPQCQTMILDKTGTLTYGKPSVTEILVAKNFDRDEVLKLAASLEQYSKHPLSQAILHAAEQSKLDDLPASEISEPPGMGMTGMVEGRQIQITSRSKLQQQNPKVFEQLPPLAAGLECVILIDQSYAATFRFRDAPRAEGESFIKHLVPKHKFERIMLLSGDRQSEVQYLADLVGIKEVYAEKTPEEKLAIVREETATRKTLYVGDGINDAPALTAASVGIAFGQNSDVTSEAAGAVVMDSSLVKLDEFLHIGRRMRTIALQSAIGGMVLSIAGMFLAAYGWLPPTAGAIGQELIDVVAVLNALRTAFPPAELSDLG